MVSGGRRAEREASRQARKAAVGLRRFPAFRAPNRRIFVVCEGTVTEREYFDQLGRDYRQSVQVVIADESGVPKTVVNIAVAAKEDASLAWDEVWAVFDRDEHVGVDEAMSIAEQAGVSVAFSNPCFELWALLHFEEQRAHIERHAAQKALTRHMPEYEKSLDLEKLSSRYEEAVSRARMLVRLAVEDGNPHKNPTTTVFKLTESIRKK